MIGTQLWAASSIRRKSCATCGCKGGMPRGARRAEAGERAWPWRAAMPYDAFVRNEPEKSVSKMRWRHIFQMETEYAIWIQAAIRRFLAKLRVARSRKVLGTAAQKMQRIFRGMRWRMRMKVMYSDLARRREIVNQRRMGAILKLQAIFRMIVAKRYLRRFVQAAIVIEAGVRGLIGRNRTLRTVPRPWRPFGERARSCHENAERLSRIQRQDQPGEAMAAIDIQAVCRGFIVRRASIP